ncbi:MAG: DNA mismatch repair endonuclease MutL [Clostridiales bacterium]|nr:DNA mismatch repair endonuclease MutL [Clostridiales bacterium]
MIKVLNSFIADKIAAGEVIERPVSVVKELIENSIDAGANSIIIEIRNGGKSYIRVTDDGCGIPSEETEIAFLRHATSKIASVKDLDNITSLGFRGEALASISAVSRLTIVTRTAQESAGSKVVLHGGRIFSTETVGANVGSTIIIEDLFYNTPARRKFMGTDAREASAIIELVEHYAIRYSDIRFSLFNNGICVFNTDGDGDILSAVTRAYPSKDYSNLIAIEEEGIKGLISNPGITKPSRRSQLFFVNGRLIQSKVIDRGIEKGYGDRIFQGYPIAILFIEVSPDTIDVNIHPGKREIKFLDQNEIIHRISNAISSVMNTEESIPSAKPTLISQVHEVSNKEISEPLNIRDYLSGLKREDETNSENIFNLSETKSHVEEYRTSYKAPSCEFEPPLNLTNIDIEKPVISPFNFEELLYKGYIFDAYIIMQSHDAIYLLDQHAAHERIFYEKFVQNFKKLEQLPQPILKPITLWVSANVYNMDRDRVHNLSKMGYDISDFGANTFIIRGIPSYMTLDESERFAYAYLEAIEDDNKDNQLVIDKLILKSCKSAVKANHRLSEIEIKDLIDNLSKCKNPFSCPHGRPTFFKVTKNEIEQSFRRK